MKSDEFIREVNEELQRDRLQALWRRYGALVVGVVLLVVLAVAAREGWQWWTDRRMQEEAVRFAAAEQLLATNRAAEAQAAFDALAAEADTGYAALARLREAEAARAAGDPAAAAQALERLAAGGDADPLLRDLAALLAAAAGLGGDGPTAAMRRLEPLAAPGQPWRDTARELLALAQIRAGELERARGTLLALTQEGTAAPAQQRRVQALLASIGGSPPAATQ